MANPLFEKLTSPRVLAQTSRALDAAWSARNLRRKPRSSASVLRRALVSAAVTQGATVAAVSAGRSAIGDQVLIEPVDGFRGPIGDVPVRVSLQWEGDPLVTEVNGKLVMVVGPGFEGLDRAAQEKLYHSTLHTWSPTSAALALGAGAAISRAALHRGVIGRRSQVSKGRAAALALAMTITEAALHAAARQVITRRRQTRVARERTPAAS